MHKINDKMLWATGNWVWRAAVVIIVRGGGGIGSCMSIGREVISSAGTKCNSEDRQTAICWFLHLLHPGIQLWLYSFCQKSTQPLTSLLSLAFITPNRPKVAVKTFFPKLIQLTDCVIRTATLLTQCFLRVLHVLIRLQCMHAASRYKLG